MFYDLMKKPWWAAFLYVIIWSKTTNCWKKTITNDENYIVYNNVVRKRSQRVEKCRSTAEEINWKNFVYYEFITEQSDVQIRQGLLQNGPIQGSNRWKSPWTDQSKRFPVVSQRLFAGMTDISAAWLKIPTTLTLSSCRITT